MGGLEQVLASAGARALLVALDPDAAFSRDASGLPPQELAG